MGTHQVYLDQQLEARLFNLVAKRRGPDQQKKIFTGDLIKEGILKLLESEGV